MKEIIYKTIEYRGYTINIVYDNDPDCPREWDNLGTIYSNCKGYDPDNHNLRELFEDSRYQDEEGCFNMKKFGKDYIYQRVYAYIHSGITIRCGKPYDCSWDSGMFGIIAVEKSRVMKQYGFKEIGDKEIDKIENILSDEIKELNTYYTGDIYGFKIKKIVKKSIPALDIMEVMV